MSNVDVKTKWLQEIDILKGIGILLIVYSHLNSFLNNYSFASFVSNTEQYEVVIGLGIFFFVSGYTLYLNNKINDIEDVLSFYKKRLLRIYPLYWLALISIILIFWVLMVTPGTHFVYDLNVTSLAINFFGLQSVIPGHNNLSLWFIGDIILCYLFYPVIVKFSKNAQDLIAIVFAIIILCTISNMFFGLVRSDFVWNFAIFGAGILFYKVDFFSDIKNLYFCIPVFFIMVILIPCYFILKIKAPLFEPLVLCGRLFFIPIGYWLVKYVSPKSNLLTGILLKLSLGTYAIYLFHAQIFSIFKKLAIDLGITGNMWDVLFILAIIPLTFYICYLIQIYLNKGMSRIFEILNRHIYKNDMNNNYK